MFGFTPEQADAANVISSAYRRYREKYQQTKSELFETDFPAKELLLTLNMRFACMKAVAGSKWPTGKEIFDPAREQAILLKIRQLAESKGINQDLVSTIFQSVIEISKAIQQPWCERVWPLSECDPDTLIEEQYQRILELAEQHAILLPELETEEKSKRILLIARDIINAANERILVILSQDTFRVDESFSDSLRIILKPLVKQDEVINRHITSLHEQLISLNPLVPIDAP